MCGALGWIGAVRETSARTFSSANDLMCDHTEYGASPDFTIQRESVSMWGLELVVVCARDRPPLDRHLLLAIEIEGLLAGRVIAPQRGTVLDDLEDELL